MQIYVVMQMCSKLVPIIAALIISIFFWGGGVLLYIIIVPKLMLVCEVLLCCSGVMCNLVFFHFREDIVPVDLEDGGIENFKNQS